MCTSTKLDDNELLQQAGLTDNSPGWQTLSGKWFGSDKTGISIPGWAINPREGWRSGVDELTPEVKTPDAPAPPPTTRDPQVAAARDKERRRALLLQGRGGTILTGPRGPSTRANVGTKTLLGQ